MTGEYRHRTASWSGMAMWIALSLAAGLMGSIPAMDAQEFYGALLRPQWAPPASVFGPVWTALYVLMGTAAGLAWRERPWALARTPWVLFVSQLIVNALWSWLFFGWHLGALAFVEILLLFALVLATTVVFWRIRPLAGALMVPYIAWLAFASCLAWRVWRDNPALL